MSQQEFPNFGTAGANAGLIEAVVKALISKWGRKRYKKATMTSIIGHLHDITALWKDLDGTEDKPQDRDIHSANDPFVLALFPDPPTPKGTTDTNTATNTPQTPSPKKEEKPKGHEPFRNDEREDWPVRYESGNWSGLPDVVIEHEERIGKKAAKLGCHLYVELVEVAPDLWIYRGLVATPTALAYVSSPPIGVCYQTAATAGIKCAYGILLALGVQKETPKPVSTSISTMLKWVNKECDRLKDAPEPVPAWRERRKRELLTRMVTVLTNAMRRAVQFAEEEARAEFPEDFPGEPLSAEDSHQVVDMPTQTTPADDLVDLGQLGALPPPERYTPDVAAKAEKYNGPIEVGMLIALKRHGVRGRIAKIAQGSTGIVFALEGHGGFHGRADVDAAATAELHQTETAEV